MVTDYKRLYEIACRVGEAHAGQLIRHANTIRILRGVIWRALMQLRTGRADLARDTLEQQIAKDQQEQGD
jgi:hypothetical protein